LGLEAYESNRPREAIEALERFDPDRGLFRDWTPYWTVLAGAYHMIGDYEGELEVALKAKERHPDQLSISNLEVRALIGLGRVDEALEVLQQSFTLGIPTGAMRTAALELTAHGFLDEAEALLERAVQWFRSQSSARLTELRSALAYTLFCQGDLEEAEELYRQLRAEQPETVSRLGYLGVIAARSGRTAEARAIDDSLAAWDRSYSRGQHTRYRVGIAAWLGERERAVALLRQAFREGQPFGVSLHRYPMLQPLWDYEPFQEFLRPRG
jgi:tetratricopeptide (TPR) repeat protein